MRREWKPGDVATSRYGVVLCCRFSGGELGWMFDDASGSPDNTPADLRPLVVIDPEDREQVGMLAASLYAEHCAFGGGGVGRLSNASTSYASGYTDAVQAALREFANPTPPKCGARLSIDYGDEGANHTCEEPKGHDGAHSDDAMSWMTGGPR